MMGREGSMISIVKTVTDHKKWGQVPTWFVTRESLQTVSPGIFASYPSEIFHPEVHFKILIGGGKLDKVLHSVLTRGALGEVVNLTKPMIESGLGGLDRPCASLITLCSSHLGHFYAQKLPKNGHIWVHRP